MRSEWPVRVFQLGEEPGDDLSSTTTPDERLAMVEALTREAFALAGIPLPSYSRAEAPVARRRLGDTATLPR